MVVQEEVTFSLCLQEREGVGMDFSFPFWEGRVVGVGFSFSGEEEATDCSITGRVRFGSPLPPVLYFS